MLVSAALLLESRLERNKEHDKGTPVEFASPTRVGVRQTLLGLEVPVVGVFCGLDNTPDDPLPNAQEEDSGGQNPRLDL